MEHTKVYGAILIPKLEDSSNMSKLHAESGNTSNLREPLVRRKIPESKKKEQAEQVEEAIGYGTVDSVYKGTTKTVDILFEGLGITEDIPDKATEDSPDEAQPSTSRKQSPEGNCVSIWKKPKIRPNVIEEEGEEDDEFYFDEELPEEENSIEYNEKKLTVDTINMPYNKKGIAIDTLPANEQPLRIDEEPIRIYMNKEAVQEEVMTTVNKSNFPEWYSKAASAAFKKNTDKIQKAFDEVKEKVEEEETSPRKLTDISI